MSEGEETQSFALAIFWAALIAGWTIVSVVVLYFTVEYRPNGLLVVFLGIWASGCWLVHRSGGLRRKPISGIRFQTDPL